MIVYAYRRTTCMKCGTPFPLNLSTLSDFNSGTNYNRYVKSTAHPLPGQQEKLEVQLIVDIQLAESVIML